MAEPQFLILHELPMNHENEYDLTIIGAGPAGMTAAIFAQNKGLSLHLIEGMLPGGQLTHLYPHKPVYNYPGYAKITGGQLAEQMLNQLKQNTVSYQSNAPIEKIEKEEESEHFFLQTPDQMIKSRSVIIAAGMGLLQPKPINAEGEAGLQGKNIFYTITNLESWKNHKVLIVGGGNSAVDHALLLAEQGCEVALVHQLNNFQAEDASVQNLRETDTEILMEYQVLSFKPTQQGRAEINIKHKKSGDICAKEADLVLINIGLKPNLSFIDSVNLEKKGKQVKVNTEMQTSESRIYACGDVVTYPGKTRLIVTAIGEA
ncbi:MAG: FAD-dependent oxidoreductase, partial [Caldithrix sp.]|nr:FAD-dependent oxidoreductase [Caldithrix sp.]